MVKGRGALSRFVCGNPDRDPDTKLEAGQPEEEKLQGGDICFLRAHAGNKTHGCFCSLQAVTLQFNPAGAFKPGGVEAFSESWSLPERGKAFA